MRQVASGKRQKRKRRKASPAKMKSRESESFVRGSSIFVEKRLRFRVSVRFGLGKT